ncbi:hypothetical protein D3C77_570900 [compost metagenome]
MHLHGRQLGENVWDVFEFRPVELHVGACAHMRVALVITAGDIRQLAQLSGRQQTIGNGDAQHRGEALDIQAVLQAQRQEFVTGKLTREESAGLIAELTDPVLDDVLVVLIVNVHEVSCFQAGYSLSRARLRTLRGRAARYQLVVIRKSDVWEYV